MFETRLVLSIIIMLFVRNSSTRGVPGGAIVSHDGSQSMAQALKKKASTSVIAEAFVIAVGKKSRKGKYPPISYPKYSWVLGEVHHYVSLYSLVG
ncbi:hypothetical protein VNO80_30729 [Phaseolus coccineus]|uniref:Uncharacterized protein n=1 Tax=Phaseolus coccineus TaxID=3886 RepID=A0AAN9QJR9_PHACN